MLLHVCCHSPRMWWLIGAIFTMFTNTANNFILKSLKRFLFFFKFIFVFSNVKNPLIVSHSVHGYVLKILNALDSKKEEFVDAQNQLLLYLG